jgi:hypothetical protein
MAGCVENLCVRGEWRPSPLAQGYSGDVDLSAESIRLTRQLAAAINPPRWRGCSSSCCSTTTGAPPGPRPTAAWCRSPSRRSLSDRRGRVARNRGSSASEQPGEPGAALPLRLRVAGAPLVGWDHRFHQGDVLAAACPGGLRAGLAGHRSAHGCSLLPAIPASDRTIASFGTSHDRSVSSATGISQLPTHGPTTAGVQNQRRHESSCRLLKQLFSVRGGT